MKALAVISIGLGACLAAQAAQAEMLVHLSRATASQMTLSGVAVLGDGQTMAVKTAAGPETVGGLLRFDSARAAEPQVVDVANFLADQGGLKGTALLSTRPDQNRKGLGHTPGAAYSVAHARAGSNLFVLVPVKLDSGVIITGTLVTDGSVGPIGPAQLLDWHIFAYHP